MEDLAIQIGLDERVQAAHFLCRPSGVVRAPGLDVSRRENDMERHVLRMAANRAFERADGVIVTALEVVGCGKIADLPCRDFR